MKSSLDSMEAKSKSWTLTWSWSSWTKLGLWEESDEVQDMEIAFEPEKGRQVQKNIVGIYPIKTREGNSVQKGWERGEWNRSDSAMSLTTSFVTLELKVVLGFLHYSKDLNYWLPEIGFVDFIYNLIKVYLFILMQIVFNKFLYLFLPHIILMH